MKYLKLSEETHLGPPKHESRICAKWRAMITMETSCIYRHRKRVVLWLAWKLCRGAAAYVICIIETHISIMKKRAISSIYIEIGMLWPSLNVGMLRIIKHLVNITVGSNFKVPIVAQNGRIISINGSRRHAGNKRGVEEIKIAKRNSAAIACARILI